MTEIHGPSNSVKVLRAAATRIRQTGDVDGDGFWAALADLLDAAADRWGVLFIAHNHDGGAADFHVRRELAVAVAWDGGQS